MCWDEEVAAAGALAVPDRNAPLPLHEVCEARVGVVTHLELGPGELFPVGGRGLFLFRDRLPEEVDDGPGVEPDDDCRRNLRQSSCDCRDFPVRVAPLRIRGEVFHFATIFLRVTRHGVWSHSVLCITVSLPS